MDAEYSSKGRTNTTNVKNVSREGLCLTVTKKPKKGSMIAIKLVVPTDYVPFSAKGRVAWVSKKAAGIEFSSIDHANKFELLDYAYEEWVNLGGKGE